MSDEKEQAGPEELWDDSTTEYGKPGYKSAPAPAPESDDGTVEVPPVAAPTPVSQDEVPTEAASPEFESETILELPVPPVGDETSLDAGRSDPLDDATTEARDPKAPASSAGFLDESTRVDEDLMDRYHEELAAQETGAAAAGEHDHELTFDDATDFELPRPALEDAPPPPAPARDDVTQDPFALAEAQSGLTDDPFLTTGQQLTTIPDVVPSSKSTVSRLTDEDAERLSQTDELQVPPEVKRAAAAESETPSPPLTDLSAEDDPTDASEPPSASAGPPPPADDALSLGTRDIAVEPLTTGVEPDLSDADADASEGAEAAPAQRSGPKGTLVLEVGEDSVSEEVDPAMLPPAFPATTGNVLRGSGGADGRPPPPPDAASADLADEAGEDDAWAGYDDSGGWHTLTGESQVVMVEPASEPAPAAPPKPMAESSSSAVFDSSQPGEAQQEVAQLVGIQGADTGRKHPIAGDEVLIGRSSRCSIVLAEPSVSRQHARIERRDDGFWVVDLDSGNGTYVNGQRIGEFRLFSGDEVTFGNGTFQFVETGERFEPVDASAAPLRTDDPPASAGRAQLFLQPLPLVIASAVMLVVVGAVFITLQISAARHEDRLRKAFASWRYGLANFEQQKWSQAEKAFNEGLEYVENHRRSRRYLHAVLRELDAEKLLAQAETALARDDLAEAYHAANGALDSIAYGRAAERVLEDIDDRVERSLRRARSARTQAEAREALRGLGFMVPYRPEIERLRREGPPRASASDDEEDEPPKKEESGAVGDSRRDGAAKQRRARVQPEGPVDRARAAFRRGDLGEARRVLNDQRSAEAIEMAAQLDRFEAALSEGRNALGSKRGAAAIQELMRASTLGRQIGGRASIFGERIAVELGRAHYLEGASAFTQQRYGAAFSHFRAALQHDPDSSAASRMLGRLGDRANELLGEARRSGDVARARALYRTVVQMVPPSHEAYRQAKRALR